MLWELTRHQVEAMLRAIGRRYDRQKKVYEDVPGAPAGENGRPQLRAPRTPDGVEELNVSELAKNPFALSGIHVRVRKA